MSRTHVLAVAALLAAVSVPAHAGTVYRWVNQEGQVVYQGSPPPAGARDVTTESFQGGAMTQAPARAPVTLYQIPHCQPCATARHYLSRHHVPFRTVDASTAAAQASMKQETGYTSVPTVTVGHHSINGFNQPWLASELTRAGYITAPAAPAAAAPGHP